MLNVEEIETFIYDIVVNFYNKMKNVCASMSNKSVKFYAMLTQ